jgi:23S rRNA (adenine2503-C2)-methyltransferase
MNNIGKSTIDLLDRTFSLDDLCEKRILVDEKDQTTKFLLETSDNELIETVLMKFNYGYSICISSQIGCNMGCKFCASGLLKKKRNLTVSELVMQVMHVNKYLLANQLSVVNNIVVMGIGEPFDNYENLSHALEIFTNHFGLAISARKITVSTSGICPRIVDFGMQFKQVSLAISLHAPTDEIRNKIMPINQSYNLTKLFAAIEKYQLISKKRITFEYLLLANVNEHEFVKSKNVHTFANILTKNKINTTIRQEKGITINAACGQLRANNLKYE